MTIWASTDWKEVESIEHRNMDIIMEDLGVALSISMEVDMEEAWQELEKMEILASQIVEPGVMEVTEYNTLTSHVLGKVPAEISQNTAKQILSAPD